jgi:phosphopantetheinyl transferase
MIHLILIQNQKTTAGERAELYLSWVGKCLSLPVNELEIIKSSTGKPSVIHRSTTSPLTKSFFFSSSHSREALLFGVSATKDFAVDLEAVLSHSKKDAVLRRFFSNEEIQHVENSTDSLRAFLNLWTRREALVKTTGEGLAGITKRVSVLNDLVEFGGETFQLVPIDLRSTSGEPLSSFLASLSIQETRESSPLLTSSNDPAFHLTTFETVESARAFLFA